MARNRPIAAHIGRLSRSKVKAYRGLFKGIKKSEPPVKAERPLTKEVTVGGEKNGGKRLVPTKKAALFYPAEDVRQPKKSRKAHRSTKLRSSITPGTVLILLAGRFSGKRVVFLKQLSSGLLLVTGPFALNGVPLRRVNQAYVIATSTKLDLSGLQVSTLSDYDLLIIYMYIRLIKLSTTPTLLNPKHLVAQMPNQNSLPMENLKKRLHIPRPKQPNKKM